MKASSGPSSTVVHPNSLYGTAHSLGAGPEARRTLFPKTRRGGPLGSSDFQLSTGNEFEVHPTRAATDGAVPLALGQLGRFARPGGNALKGTPAVNVRTCRCPLDACRGAVNGQEV